MPHIDEGTLHALLDGALGAGDRSHAERVRAHLDSCVDCRALLEAAEADRHRAGEILGALDAELDGIAEPDFEEVLVRGGGVRGAAAGGASTSFGGDDPASRDSAQPRLRRQARWTRGVAWAASLVLALGTGYLIRDRIMPERSASMEVSAPRQPAMEDAATGEVGELPPEATADAERESAGAPEGDQAASTTASPPPPAPAPAPRQSAERLAPTDAQTGGGGTAIDAGDAAEKSAEAVSQDRRRAEAVEEASRRSAQRALADQPLGVSAATAPNAPPAPAPPTRRAEDAALASQAAGATAPDSYATALAFVRGMHYTVPDRPVDRVEVYDVGGALGARTIQTLADGTTVILLQRVMEGESQVLDLEALEAAVAADLPEAVRAELRSVMIRRGDQIIVITAPLAETELRRVAEALAPHS